jgi:hypothetical protein
MMLYVYHCGPIDCWAGWRPLRELLIQDADGVELPGPQHVQQRWELAQDLAKRIYWEGDVRSSEGGPWWTPIPWETGDWEYVIAWKQDNNGSTFVASPVQLPWLVGTTAWMMIDSKQWRITELGAN